MNPHDALEELTNCTICLERFTNPKALPCQHTYCLNCLRGMVQNQSKLTCPHCREVHTIPSNGVQGFKNNLVIKNLLELNFEHSKAEDAQVSCFDCKKNGTLSKCEHCSQKVCVDCRVAHNKLSWEIDTVIVGLQDIVESQKCRAKYWQRQKVLIDVEFKKQQHIFQQLREKLENRQKQLENAMNRFDFATQIFAGECTLPNTKAGMEEKFHFGKSTQGLKETKSTIVKLKSVMRMMTTGNDIVKFVGEDHQQIGDQIATFGLLKFGETVISTEDCDHETSRAFLPRREGGGDDISIHSRTDDPAGNDDQSPSTSAFSQSKADSTRHLFPLPSSIDYAKKVVRDTRLDEIIIMGPYCTISNDDPFLVSNPNSAHFNPSDNRIYVCCIDANRVISFDENGHRANVVFITKHPTAMTIANDGNVYIAEADGRIRRGDCVAGYSGILEEQNDDVRVDQLVSYNDKLLAYDSRSKVLHTLNLEGQLLRSMKIAANVVLGMVLDGQGHVYLATEDRGQCYVLVYTLNGEKLFSINVNSKELGDIGGVLVDGDGYILVSRPIANRIDVYNSEQRYVRYLDGSLNGVGAFNTPTGLSWLPDGRIMICDSENNRVVAI